MKKTLKNLFIGLAPLTILPTTSLAISCDNTKKIDIQYLEMSTEGAQFVEFIKSMGWKKELEYGDVWTQRWNAAKERGDDFLENSFQESVNQASDATKAAFSKYVPIKTGSLQTYYIDPESGTYERVVFYIHGGAYFNNILTFHADALLAIANKFHARVYIPNYPLVPQVTFEACYAFLDAIYGRISNELEKNKDIIFIGDSAGGGLVLAYSEYIQREKANVRLPVARVCISPWCDVTMSNPDIEEKVDSDVFLAPFGLGVIGNFWAGNLPPTNYRISPYYGKLNDKIPTFFSCCSNEIFMPDVIKTFKKLTDNGCKTKLVIGNGLFHVFPVLTTLPESKQVWDIAYEFVINNK